MQVVVSLKWYTVQSFEERGTFETDCRENGISMKHMVFVILENEIKILIITRHLLITRFCIRDRLQCM